MALADYLKRSLASRLAQSKAGELQAEEARKTPVMRQHEYAVARKSILGDLSSMPTTVIQECVTNEKAARRKQRLELVNRTLQSCPKHAKEAARLRGDMDEVENMRCAKHVYLANDPDAPPELRDNPPPGFRKATREELNELGLKEGLLTPAHSNFRAAVYIKDEAVWGVDQKPNAVLAFRGSTSAEEDWQNNFNQDSDREAEYYRNAVQIGNRLASHTASIHIVGHSLGGGLASAAQGGSGLTASTYNAAGLHPNTVARYSHLKQVVSDPDKITAIRVKGEVVTKIQEDVIGSSGLSLLANNAVGRKRDLEPCHDEDHLEELKVEGKVDQKEAFGTYLHGMDEVIESLESSKRADEATLRRCLGRQGDC